MNEFGGTNYRTELPGKRRSLKTYILFYSFFDLSTSFTNGFAGLVNSGVEEISEGLCTSQGFTLYCNTKNWVSLRTTASLNHL